MFKVYDLMVENFKSPNTSQERNQKLKETTVRQISKSHLDYWISNKIEKIEILNILRYIFLQSRTDKVACNHGISLTFRIIILQF